MRILVLCTGNSCRSILGEALFNDLGNGRVTAYSAGSNPVGAVNPAAIARLRQEGHSTSDLRSKSWDQFTGPDAAAIDVVITVCDNAAGESCPVWNSNPVTVHWGIADPADANDEQSAEQIEAAFDLAYKQLRSRIEQVLELPFESMDIRYRKDALQRIHDAASTRDED
jgi:arsenate reductase